MRRFDFLEGIRVNEPSTISGVVYSEADFSNPALQKSVEDGRILVTFGIPGTSALEMDKVSGVVDSIAIEDGRVKVGWKLIEGNAGHLVKAMLDQGFDFAVRPNGLGIIAEDGVQDYELRSVSLCPPAPRPLDA